MADLAAENSQISHHIIKGRSNQDFAWTWEKDKNYLIIYGDGHGTNVAIEILRAFDYTKFTQDIENVEPIDIVKELQDVVNTRETLATSFSKSSGSTISVVVKVDKYIKMAWLGDSSIKIFRNNQLYFVSNDHNVLQDREGLGVKKIKHAYACEINNDGIMEQIYKPYVIHTDHDYCSVTRALGHGNKAYNLPETKMIEIDEISDWKLVGASDGLHDVVGNSKEDLEILSSRTCDEIAQIAKERWSPEYLWSFLGADGSKSQQSFGINDMDDIVVVIWEQKRLL